MSSHRIQEIINRAPAVLPVSQEILAVFEEVILKFNERLLVKHETERKTKLAISCTLFDRVNYIVISSPDPTCVDFSVHYMAPKEDKDNDAAIARKNETHTVFKVRGSEGSISLQMICFKKNSPMIIHPDFDAFTNAILELMQTHASFDPVEAQRQYLANRVSEEKTA